MANLFNINDKNILATASITITDQTDAATLAGGISVVSGSKNQVYITGLSNPYSPDWTKNYLVIRPHLIATSITKLSGGLEEYNPDLFDPDEYPNLNKPNGVESEAPYINPKELQWYLRDASGTETLINPETNFNFSFMFTHNNVIYNDKRYLVIQNNFIPKDSFVTIICKFSFYDPFAKLFIPQQYEIDISCLSTGRGENRLTITSVNGTSIYNNNPEYIDLYASYFEDGNEINIQSEVENQTQNATINWFIRSTTGNGWTLLDGSKQNEDGYEFKDLFEVRRYISHDPTYNTFNTEETTNIRGGFYLRIHPGLINGSSIIKAVYKPNAAITDMAATYTALEVVYDMTDDVQAYIHSSNGDKIYNAIKSVGTTLSCMLKYQGQILPESDPRYDTNFEYYWFKVSSDGLQTWNVYLDNQGELIHQEITQDTEDIIELKSSSRVLPIQAKDVDKINMFQCAVVDKEAMRIAEMRSRYIQGAPSEDDLITASLLNADLGIDAYDQEELLNTAYEINASNITNGTSLID